MGSSKFFTRNYTSGETLSVNTENNVMQLSLKVLTGTCQLKGNAKFGNAESENIQLGTGEPVVFTGYGPNAPLEGITITPDADSTVRVILHY